jgi:uncharacterized protein (DUF885 family)
MTEAAEGVKDPALAALLRDHWAWVLEQDPIFATRLGVRRYDDKLSDRSQAAVEARKAKRRALLQRAKGIDASALSDADRLSHELLVEELESAIASEVCRFDAWTLNARSNPITRYNRLPEDHKLRSAADVTTLLARYRAIGPSIDQEGAALRRGIADGLFAPAESVRRVLSMVDEQLEADPATWAMAKPAKTIADAVRGQELLGIIQNEIKPALTRYRDLLRDEILPRARAEDATGLSSRALGKSC